MAKPKRKRKHGGAREGAGRPRSKLPDQVINQIGSIPIGDPLGQARWYTNAIGVLTLGVLCGEPWKDLLETVRASAGAAGRVLPHDIVFEAARILEEGERDMKNTGSTTPTKRSDAPVIGAGASRRNPH